MAEEAGRTGPPPRLLLVTGMSGAGKSTVLDTLVTSSRRGGGPVRPASSAIRS